MNTPQQTLIVTPIQSLEELGILIHCASYTNERRLFNYVNKRMDCSPDLKNQKPETLEGSSYAELVSIRKACTENFRVLDELHRAQWMQEELRQKAVAATGKRKI